MSELFLKIINMSISASWLILAVLIFRLILKKAPKWVNVLLWGIVAVRLICPFTIESPISMIPDSVGSGELVSEWMDDYVDDIDIHHSDSIYYDAAVGAGREPISDGEGGYYVVTKHDQLGEPATIENTVMPILSIVWVVGIAVLTLYTIISYWHLWRKVDTAVLYKDNIFQSENVISPFVLGIIKPRIYLPFKMDSQNLEYVVLHEQAHIRRKDHWWKHLGFLLLTVHWFNPLMWLAYVLLCRDIELACDEKVIKVLGNEQRADYTQALVVCSMNRRIIAACPLAFGEVGVKVRVKSVMNYKKPAFWIVILAIISCIIIAMCFLTNPIAKNTVVMGANYDIEKVLYAVPIGDEISTEPPLQYCVTADYHLYYQQTEGEDWNYLGALTSYELTNDELNNYMPVDDMRKDAKVSQITDAYILKVEDDNFYLVFQTKKGETYLAYGWEDVGERGQAGSDDTRLRCLYLLDSSFHSGYVNDKNDGEDLSNSSATSATSSIKDIVDPTKDENFAYDMAMEKFFEDESNEYFFSGIYSQYVIVHYTDGTTEDICTALKNGRATIADLDRFNIRYWAESKEDDLDAAISAAILDHYASDKPDGLIHVESHVLLANETVSGTPQTGAVNHMEITELLDEISSSPGVFASGPDKYIKAHQSEYQELLSYGEYTLRYCFSEFLYGDQTDLRGQIMALVCQDIMLVWGEGYAIDYEPVTGQGWFDEFRGNAENLSKQFSLEELKKNFPGTFLLLQMSSNEFAIKVQDE